MKSLKPIIAMTAGDIAGIGPEVILRAIAQPATSLVCYPVLIGHPQIFRQAAEIFGLTVPLQELTTTVQDSARFREDVVSAATHRRTLRSIIWTPPSRWQIASPSMPLSQLHSTKKHFIWPDIIFQATPKFWPNAVVSLSSP